MLLFHPIWFILQRGDSSLDKSPHLPWVWAVACSPKVAPFQKYSHTTVIIYFKEEKKVLDEVE